MTTVAHIVKDATRNPANIEQLREQVIGLTNDPQEQRQLAQIVNDYFSTPNDKLFRITHNGASADCWANTVEFSLLKDNRELLAHRFSQLIKEGHITKSDFFHDPMPDGEKQVDGQHLGPRKGLSLAWDLGCQRKFNAPYAANDFQIEKFESWVRGEQTSVVFRGRGILDDKTHVAHNGTATIDNLFSENSMMGQAQAVGMRFSIRWPAAHDSAGSKELQVMYHMVEVVHVGKDSSGRTGVFFYQPLNILGTSECGPDRTRVSGNLEFMPLENFKDAVRCAFVPSHILEEVGGERIVDPAYYRGTSTQAERKEREESYVEGQRPDVYQAAAVEFFRERSKRFFDDLAEISKQTKTIS